MTGLIKVRTLLPFTLLALALLPARLRSDDPVSSSVTFNREIVRIMDRKCLPCHGTNSVAMPLTTYRDVRPWARAIREELVEQRMPPWGAAQGYVPLVTNPGLSARETTMILTWVDGGLPRGDERELPKPSASPASPAVPGHVLHLPAQSVPAGVEHLERRLTTALPTGLRSLQRVEIRPGDRRVLRAAFARIVGGASGASQWVGAWTPWQSSIAPPPGTFFNVPSGARLEVDLHYRGRDIALDDRTSVALYAHDASGPAAGQLILRSASAARSGASTASVTLRRSTKLWAIVPHLAAAADSRSHATDAPASSVEITARKPDGSVEVLLWVPRYRVDWPTPYVLRDVVDLPAGTTVTLTVTGPGAALNAKPSATLAISSPGVSG